jgi:hypothetical protein
MAIIAGQKSVFYPALLGIELGQSYFALLPKHVLLKA